MQPTPPPPKPFNLVAHQPKLTSLDRISAGACSVNVYVYLGFQIGEAQSP